MYMMDESLVAKTVEILWHGIKSIIRKRYKTGYIVLDVGHIAYAIDLIAKHYKITQCAADIRSSIASTQSVVVARLCDFLQKRGFVVCHRIAEVTISWPFYFLGPNQINV